MAKTKKCAHAVCTCQVPEDGEFGKYCSEHCRDMAEMAELRCECGHPECK
jgi:hypothetical protein